MTLTKKRGLCWLIAAGMTALLMTFVLTCANDGVGYIPSAYGYHHGCYEADCTRIAPGTGEELVTEYLQLLGNLYTKA